jgi:hypothetical protein
MILTIIVRNARLVSVKNCGREMHKRDLELGQDMSRRSLNTTRSEVVNNMEPNEYEEFITGRFEPLDKLPWYRKCKDSVTCEAYKNSKIQKNSSRIFSTRGNPTSKFTYYDNTSTNTPPYKRTKDDTHQLPKQCDRCGGNIKNNLTVKNKHPFWGIVCNDCSDVFKR